VGYLEPADGVCAARIHVNARPRLLLGATNQAFPRILVQEPHRYVKRRTTPAFKRVRIRKCPTCFLCNIGYVNRAQARCEQGLVCITPRRIHDERARVLADGLCKCLWPFFRDDVPPADFAREGCVERGATGIIAVLKRGNDDFILETRFALWVDIRLLVVTIDPA
jgi:hypothetical protein